MMRWRADVKHFITIENDGNSSIQVKISNASNRVGSTKFYPIVPRESSKWERYEREVVFVNVGGAGRVAAWCITCDGTATFESDHHFDAANAVYNYNFNSGIGVTNRLDTPIQVKVSNSNSSDESGFYKVAPKATIRWSRENIEVIYVKESISSNLATYYGIPGQDLEIDSASISPFPVFASTPDLTGNAVNVRNDTNSDIWVAISNATGHAGESEHFRRIPPNTSLAPWNRVGTEAIYVTGSDPGQPVAAYYGEVGKTLIVNKPIEEGCKKADAEEEPAGHRRKHEAERLGDLERVQKQQQREEVENEQRQQLQRMTENSVWRPHGARVITADTVVGGWRARAEAKRW